MCINTLIFSQMCPFCFVLLCSHVNGIDNSLYVFLPCMYILYVIDEEGLKFLQAEKFIYEKALIGIERSKSATPNEGGGGETRTLSSSLGASGSSSIGSTGTGGGGGGAVEEKAESLDNLAQLMLESGKFDLALDYASKAVKIRRQLYGYDHELTTASLEKFGAAFAATGRDSYRDALERRNVENSDKRNKKKGKMKNKKGKNSKGDDDDDSNDDDAEVVEEEQGRRTPDLSNVATKPDGMDITTALAGMTSYEASLARYQKDIQSP